MIEQKNKELEQKQKVIEQKDILIQIKSEETQKIKIELNAVYNSKRFRVISCLLYPYTKIKNILKER